MRDGSLLRLLVLMTALVAGIGSQIEAAEAAKHQKVRWRATDGSVEFVSIGDRVWIERRRGLVMPHRYHHYRSAGKALFLYDLKRHLKVKLFPTMALMRWNLRKQLNFWMLYRWGRWHKNQRAAKVPSKATKVARKAAKASKMPRKVAKVPLSRAATSRPSQKPASRPVRGGTSRPSSRPVTASRATSRPVRSQTKPLRRQAPPQPRLPQAKPPQAKPPQARLPQMKPRAIFPMTWRAKGIKRFFYHVGGRLWREVRKGRFTGERFLEVSRGRKFVKLFDPRRKVWLSLTQTTWYLRFKPRGAWNRLMSGSWHKGRPVVRASWRSRNGDWRFHQVSTRTWQTFYKGRVIGKPLFLLRKRRRYLDMRNRRRLVRIYKGHLFGKLLRPGRKWRLLLRGAWDQDPPNLRVPRRRRKPTKTTKPKKRSLGPVARKAPKKRPTKRALLVARGSGVLPPQRRKAPPKVPVPRTRAIAKVAPRARRLPKRPVPRAKARKRPVKVLSRRLRVKETQKRPWSSVAFVRTLRRDKSKGFATGVMIGPRLLLTTGSVVFRRNTRKTVKAISIYPAINHRSTPFGYTAGVRWYAHPKWIKSKKNSIARHYDLGIVVLRSPLGRRTKWLTPLPSQAGAFKKGILTMAGYPLDKFYKTRHLWQWQQRILGNIDLDDSYPMKWHIPTRHKTSRGSLGSPLMWKQGKRWRLLGLYHGTTGKYAESVRITKEHMKWIRRIQRVELRRWKQELARARERLLPKDPVPDELRFWEGKPLKLEDQGGSSSTTFP